MYIKSDIRQIKIIAFFLFLVPVVALIGSLAFHNLMVSFKFSHEDNFNFEKNLPGDSKKFLCDESNKYCDIIFERVDKLNKCNIYIIDQFTLSEKGEILKKNNKPNFDINMKENKISREFKISSKLNDNCILNSSLIKYYNFVPSVFEWFFNLKVNKKTSLGSSQTVNPIFYGETSISNIVKRYPIKLVFKPLMYLSVILMIFYWYYNNAILNKLLQTQKKSWFFIFGVLSAIFLLFHVIFLGWSFENEILAKGRRYFIVFFILFEVLAQAFLIREIFKKKDDLKEFINKAIVYSKLIFVFLICISTIFIFALLTVYNLDNKVDYILEWNYFLILLIFYFLSSIMWKKIN